MIGEDRLAKLAFFALGLLIIGGATTMPLGSLLEPAAGFLPLLIGAGMVLTSAAGLTGRGRLERIDWPAPDARWRLVAFAGLMTAYLAAVPIVGFSVATFCFCLVGVRWLMPYRHGLVLAIALATSAVVHVVFRTLLQQPLPSGLLNLG